MRFISWVSWRKRAFKRFTGLDWAWAVAGASLRGKGNDSYDLLNIYLFDTRVALDKQDKQDPMLSWVNLIAQIRLGRRRMRSKQIDDESNEM